MTTTVVARFQHPSWLHYAAFTLNSRGIKLPNVRFLLVARGGTPQDGHRVRFVLDIPSRHSDWITAIGVVWSYCPDVKWRAAKSWKRKLWGVMIAEGG